MFLYDLGQVVYYLNNNVIHSAPILSRMYVDNAHSDWACTDKQKQFFERFGESKIVYATCHGEFTEDKVFPSKEELAKSL